MLLPSILVLQGKFCSCSFFIILPFRTFYLKLCHTVSHVLHRQSSKTWGRAATQSELSTLVVLNTQIISHMPNILFGIACHWISFLEPKANIVPAGQKVSPYSKQPVIRLSYISLKSIYHYNSLILPAQIGKTAAEEGIYAAMWLCFKRPCHSFLLPNGAWLSLSMSLAPHIQDLWKSLCTSRPLTIHWSVRGDHSLKVPLQAVYWGFLSHKWPPGILLSFPPSPLLNSSSYTKMPQSTWKDRNCSGSDSKSGKYR